jgi:hypothetical protein
MGFIRLSSIGGENGFGLSTYCETIWPQEREEPPVRDRKIITAEKCCFQSFGRRQGSMIDMLPKDERFDSQSFGQHV